MLAAYKLVERSSSHYFVVWNRFVFVDLFQRVQVLTPELCIALGLFQTATHQSFIRGGCGHPQHPVTGGFLAFDLFGVTCELGFECVVCLLALQFLFLYPPA
ncbi:hypothetical protein D3C76_1572830 [compost metagenome]